MIESSRPAIAGAVSKLWTGLLGIGAAALASLDEGLASLFERRRFSRQRFPAADRDIDVPGLDLDRMADALGAFARFFAIGQPTITASASGPSDSQR